MDYQDEKYLEDYLLSKQELAKLLELRGKSCTYGGVDIQGCNAVAYRIEWLRALIERAEVLLRQGNSFTFPCGCVLTKDGVDWKSGCAIPSHEPNWRKRAEDAEAQCNELCERVMAWIDLVDNARDVEGIPWWRIDLDLRKIVTR